jgi:hypothetical protein
MVGCRWRSLGSLTIPRSEDTVDEDGSTPISWEAINLRLLEYLTT